MVIVATSALAYLLSGLASGFTYAQGGATPLLVHLEQVLPSGDERHPAIELKWRVYRLQNDRNTVSSYESSQLRYALRIFYGASLIDSILIDSTAYRFSEAELDKEYRFEVEVRGTGIQDVTTQWCKERSIEPPYNRATARLVKARYWVPRRFFAPVTRLYAKFRKQGGFLMWIVALLTGIGAIGLVLLLLFAIKFFAFKRYRPSRIRAYWEKQHISGLETELQRFRLLKYGPAIEVLKGGLRTFVTEVVACASVSTTQTSNRGSPMSPWLWVWLGTWAGIVLKFLSAIRLKGLRSRVIQWLQRWWARGQDTSLKSVLEECAHYEHLKTRPTVRILKAGWAALVSSPVYAGHTSGHIVLPVGGSKRAHWRTVRRTQEALQSAIQGEVLRLSNLDLPWLRRYRNQAWNFFFSIEFFWNFAVVAPLFGLLGTVTGIAKSFGQVSTAVKPDVAALYAKLAPGINEALYTTIAGLCLALPFVFIYFVLKWRISCVQTTWAAVADEFIKQIEGA